MALPAFLIPALTGFAISKLTGASTKKALQSALLGAAVGGITQGFGADAAAKPMSPIIKIFFRPTKSAMRPPKSKSEPKASV